MKLPYTADELCQ